MKKTFSLAFLIILLVSRLGLAGTLQVTAQAPGIIV
jgi:hypothetical protein